MPPLSNFQKSCIAVAVSQALFSPVANSATINVAGDCTLKDAVMSANTNTSVSTCVAGDTAGTDTITISGQYIQVAAPSAGLSAYTISSSILIDGGENVGATLRRDTESTQDTRFFEVGAGADLYLRNIALRYGQVLGANGGAILVDGGDLSLRRVTIERNIALAASGTGGQGGAIYFSGGGNLNINLSSLERNVAAQGGAIVVSGDADLDLQTSNFSRNNAFESGGAISARGAGNISSKGSLFRRNTAALNGGAIDSSVTGEITISGGEVSSNSATIGGAIYVSAGSLTGASTAFRYNRTRSYDAQLSGGALFVGGSAFTTIDQSSFINNRSNTYSYNSLSISNPNPTEGGAITIDTSSTELNSISNSTLSGNVANQGGGLNLLNGRTQVINSTIAGGRSNQYIRNLSKVTIPPSSAGVYLSSTAELELSNTAIGFGGEYYSPVRQNNMPDDLCIISDPSKLTLSGNNRAGDGSCGLPNSGDLKLSRLMTGGESSPYTTVGSPNNTYSIREQASYGFHVPMPGSPLSEAGDITVCSGAPITSVDQRGEVRPNDVCDIGAIEVTQGTIVVNTTDNPTDNTAVCSLNDALVAVGGEGSLPRNGSTCDAAGDINVIQFDTGVFPLNAQSVINLTRDLPRMRSAIATIQGPGKNALEVNGGGQFDGFYLGRSNVSLNDFSLRDTYNQNYAGGAIGASRSAISINNMEVSNNEMRRGRSAAITARYSTLLKISNSQIVSNTASYNRYAVGGVMARSNSFVEMVNTTVADNYSASDRRRYSAGGVYVGQNTQGKLSNVTISGNTAPQGGRAGGLAVSRNAKVSLNNSTITQNFANGNSGGEGGGGVFVYGNGGEGGSSTYATELRISNSVISDNFLDGSTAGDEIGVYQTNATSAPKVIVQSSVIGDAAKMFDEAISLTANFAGFPVVIPNGLALSQSNFIATSTQADGSPNPDATAAGNIVFGFRFAPSMGDTPVHFLPPNSPALDLGSGSLCPRTDQLGRPRMNRDGLMFPIVAASNGKPFIINLDGECDAGAVEFTEGDLDLLP